MAKVMRVGIYGRVSTGDQTTVNQLDELRAIGEQRGWDVVAVVHDDGVSGTVATASRPECAKLLKLARQGKIDLVAAWSVDRLGRSLLDLVGFLKELHAVGCGLYLHTQGFDTTTPAGNAMFQMCGVFAEFERSIIVERVRAGIARAKAHGTRSGKPIGRPSLKPAREDKVRALLADGKGIGTICRELKIGSSQVQRIKREMTQPEA